MSTHVLYKSILGYGSDSNLFCTSISLLCSVDSLLEHDYINFDPKNMYPFKSADSESTTDHGGAEPVATQRAESSEEATTNRSRSSSLCHDYYNLADYLPERDENSFAQIKPPNSCVAPAVDEVEGSGVLADIREGVEGAVENTEGTMTMTEQKQGIVKSEIEMLDDLIESNAEHVASNVGIVQPHTHSAQNITAEQTGVCLSPPLKVAPKHTSKHKENLVSPLHFSPPSESIETINKNSPKVKLTVPTRKSSLKNELSSPSLSSDQFPPEMHLKLQQLMNPHESSRKNYEETEINMKFKSTTPKTSEQQRAGRRYSEQLMKDEPQIEDVRSRTTTVHSVKPRIDRPRLNQIRKKIAAQKKELEAVSEAGSTQLTCLQSKNEGRPSLVETMKKQLEHKSNSKEIFGVDHKLSQPLLSCEPSSQNGMVVKNRGNGVANEATTWPVISPRIPPSHRGTLDKPSIPLKPANIICPVAAASGKIDQPADMGRASAGRLEEERAAEENKKELNSPPPLPRRTKEMFEEREPLHNSVSRNYKNVFLKNASDAPTPGPADAPTPGPADAPTPGPTGAPTPGPTGAPTPGPTGAPTPGPTGAPTPGPTGAKTNESSKSLKKIYRTTFVKSKREEVVNDSKSTMVKSSFFKRMDRAAEMSPTVKSKAGIVLIKDRPLPEIPGLQQCDPNASPDHTAMDYEKITHDDVFAGCKSYHPLLQDVLVAREHRHCSSSQESIKCENAPFVPMAQAKKNILVKPNINSKPLKATQTSTPCSDYIDGYVNPDGVFDHGCCQPRLLKSSDSTDSREEKNDLNYDYPDAHVLGAFARQAWPCKQEKLMRMKVPLPVNSTLSGSGKDRFGKRDSVAGGRGDRRTVSLEEVHDTSAGDNSIYLPMCMTRSDSDYINSDVIQNTLSAQVSLSCTRHTSLAEKSNVIEGKTSGNDVEKGSEFSLYMNLPIPEPSSQQQVLKTPTNSYMTNKQALMNSGRTNTLPVKPKPCKKRPASISATSKQQLIPNLTELPQQPGWGSTTLKKVDDSKPVITPPSCPPHITDAEERKAKGTTTLPPRDILRSKTCVSYKRN